MDDKRPLDVALDLLVYAPVGLAVSARGLLGVLAERGRERMAGQVTNARAVGKFAVQQGQVQAEKAFTRARDDARERIEALGGRPTVPLAPSPRTTRAVAGDGPRAATSSPAGDDLAIPGYDSLSASQVLPRLDGLAPLELEAVRAYEAGHRGRKTILGRIGQLQSAS